ncbi:MAG: NAD(+) synthase [Anaerovoracaceae bacterium]
MSKNNYEFLRIAGCVPQITLVDPEKNAEKVISMLKKAEKEKVGLAVFPMLTLTGVTCGDLFFQGQLYHRQISALEKIIAATEGMAVTGLVGFFASCGAGLYNCMAVIQGGRVIKILAFPPSRRMLRWFPHQENIVSGMTLGGEEVTISQEPFSDGRVKIGFSQDCDIILNLDHQNQLVGSRDFYRSHALSQSGSYNCGYVYLAPGIGESTASGVYGGHCIVAENGEILAESSLFSREDTMTLTEIDCGKILYRRSQEMISLSWETFHDTWIDMDDLSYVGSGTLLRSYSQTPFVPEDYSNVCDEIFQIQAHALARRIEASHAAKMIIGISGGLDSTLAVLVCHRACEILGISPQNVITVTMPGFGTTNHTYENALALMRRLGTDLREIPIAQSVRLHFADIGHDETVQDVTYENAQARERTQILMDIANMEGGLVVGTGDLSEAALGWCTYNGDHMSMYSVNGNVPKTLVGVLVKWYAENTSDPALAETLLSIADTPISPELLPPDEAGNIAQKTEDNVGPYVLHDFFLYHTIRSGWQAEKLLFVAEQTFAGIYDKAFIRKWQQTFYRRFATQQFKRNCSPDGPQVGSLSLSPHGGWIMPSDGSWEMWMK